MTDRIRASQMSAELFHLHSGLCEGRLGEFLNKYWTHLSVSWRKEAFAGKISLLLEHVKKLQCSLGFLYLGKANTLVKPHSHTLTEKFRKLETFLVLPLNKCLWNTHICWMLSNCGRGSQGHFAPVPYRGEDKTNINLIMKINSDACMVGEVEVLWEVHPTVTSLKPLTRGKHPQAKKMSVCQFQVEGAFGLFIIKWEYRNYFFTCFIASTGFSFDCTNHYSTCVRTVNSQL